MGTDTGNDTLTITRRERLDHRSGITESTGAARSAIAQQGPPGAQTHSGQMKHGGQAPTGSKDDDGRLAGIIPDCITAEHYAWNNDACQVAVKSVKW